MKKINLRFISIWTSILMLVALFIPCISHLEYGEELNHSIFEEMLGRTITGYELGSANYLYIIAFLTPICVFIGWIKMKGRPFKLMEIMQFILLTLNLLLFYRLWVDVNRNILFDHKIFNNVFYVNIALSVFLFILFVGDVLGIIVLDVYQIKPSTSKKTSTKIKVIKCPKCGAKISNDTKYCIKCGNKI